MRKIVRTPTEIKRIVRKMAFANRFSKLFGFRVCPAEIDFYPQNESQKNPVFSKTQKPKT